MRGATLLIRIPPEAIRISTHAPHAGSDIGMPTFTLMPLDFNPRSPCGERQRDGARFLTQISFQPTLPMRGATLASACTAASNAHFNPRSPCGERRNQARKRPRHHHFNPRSPCGERPPAMDGVAPRVFVFQPTLPMRGATARVEKPGTLRLFQPTLPMRGATATYCVAHYIFTRYSQIS